MNYLFSYGEYPFLQYQSVFLVKNCLDGFDQHVNLNEFKLKENHRVTEQGHWWYAPPSRAADPSPLRYPHLAFSTLLVKSVLSIGLSPRKTPPTQTWFYFTVSERSMWCSTFSWCCLWLLLRYWYVIPSTVTERAEQKTAWLQHQWRKSRTKEGQKNGELNMVILEALYLRQFLGHDYSYFIILQIFF